MTATAPGWYGAGRQAELAVVARMIHLWPYQDVPPERKWTAVLVGDCTCKAAWACARLADAGWPAEAMEFHCCDLGQAAQPDRGERPEQRHAVLVVNVTLPGDCLVFDLRASPAVLAVVLDCRHPTPMRFDDLGYSDWSKVPAPLDWQARDAKANYDLALEILRNR